MIRPNIFIVTPSFNSGQTIDRTINSVVSQSGDFDLHYHVQDGGSKDKTVEIIEKWINLIDRNIIPIFCKSLKITYKSEKDSGMYEAIAKGFQRHKGSSNDWTGWINSDDILLPGVFSLLSEVDKQLVDSNIDWITGASSVDWDDLPVAWGDRPVNRDIISAGLCEGDHWSFIQQEGTFFRKKLWDSVDIKNGFSSFKYAGDWNLWRMMAKDNEIYQTPWPTGTFSRREGQISQSKKEEYLDEIDRTIPPEVRSKRLLEISSKPGPRWMVESRFKDRSLHAIKYTLNSQLRTQKEKLIRKMFADGGNGGESLVRKTGIISYNSEWQYPAITEKHAFDSLLNSNIKFKDGVVYFAFPWATLIDLLQVSSDQLWKLQAKLSFFAEELKGFEKVVTVCQHIWFKKYLHIFELAGVTDIFASHATPDDFKYNNSRSIKIYPFQLYPVQQVDSIIEVNERKYLYSFVGAKAGEGYLSKARDWISEDIKQNPDVYVIIRDGWHYDQIVYEEQIKKNSLSTSDKTTMSSKEVEYKDVLSNSVFTLCPSGTGPNSIRLWEAIENNVIPVVISDKYLSPCDNKLWSKGVIVIGENRAEVINIDNTLRGIFDDKQKMQDIFKHLLMIKNEYGLNSFITPLKRFLLDDFSDSNLVKFHKKNGGSSDALDKLIALHAAKEKDNGNNVDLLGDYLFKRVRFLSRDRI